MRYTVNSIFIIIGIALMLFACLFSAILPSGLDYVDEFFCVAVIILFLISMARGKRVFKFYFWFLLLIPIGFLGNLMYDVQSDFNLAVQDAFLFIKPYVLLMYILTSVNEFQAWKIYKFLMRVSKIIIITLSAFSVLTILWNMGIARGLFGMFAGMVDYKGMFVFYAGFGGTVAELIILALAVVASDSKNNRLLYFILSLIVILRVDSGLGNLSIVAYMAVYFFLEKQKRFRWYYLLIIVPLCLWVGRGEIMGYLLNSDAPRYKLFYFSFITAWQYFPIGAGFAAYGSTTAMTHYSSLYYRYKFNLSWGMKENETFFLMDSYYPQIVGQLGFLGTVIYIIFMVKLFFKIIWSILNIAIKSAAVYLLGVWFVAGLGFGTSSLWGCMVFAIISILYLTDKYHTNIAGGD